MRKTSVYLTEADSRRLAELARVEGRPQAQILRDAIAAYTPRGADRAFALTRSGRGPGDSVSGMSEDELLEGFGE